MADSNPAARTRLEQLVRRRRRAVTEFCEDFQAASEQVGKRLAVSERQASRWMAGLLDGLPHPSACRVLEHMFDEPAETLFAAPEPEQVAHPATSAAPAHAHKSPDVDNGEYDDHGAEKEIAMAATESARFGQFAEQTNTGPHTLEQFRTDIARIVDVYPNRPVHPTFVEVRELRNRAFELLEGRQPPNQTRDLYRVAAVLCGVLANASFDLGWSTAAETQARTAFLCAELAGHNALRSWIRGTQSLIAYWDERPRLACELAADGWQYRPETGTARVRLAAIEARAQARMRDHRAADDALARAEQARDELDGPDEPGGMMAFPLAKQTFYAATAKLWLGGDDHYREAERHATEAVNQYEQAPPEQRRLGELCLARLDLAVARLGRADLDGTADQVDEVLAIAGQRRTDSVVRRLHQLATALERPTMQSSSLALGLRDRITTFCTTPATPAQQGDLP